MASSAKMDTKARSNRETGGRAGITEIDVQIRNLHKQQAGWVLSAGKNLSPQVYDYVQGLWFPVTLLCTTKRYNAPIIRKRLRRRGRAIAAIGAVPPPPCTSFAYSETITASDRDAYICNLLNGNGNSKTGSCIHSFSSLLVR